MSAKSKQLLSQVSNSSDPYDKGADCLSTVLHEDCITEPDSSSDSRHLVHDSSSTNNLSSSDIASLQASLASELNLIDYKCTENGDLIRTELNNFDEINNDIINLNVSTSIGVVLSNVVEDARVYPNDELQQDIVFVDAECCMSNSNNACTASAVNDSPTNKIGTDDGSNEMGPIEDAFYPSEYDAQEPDYIEEYVDVTSSCNESQKVTPLAQIRLELNFSDEKCDDVPEIVHFKTKKFYESEDSIINKIFSQTIYSAGVTPTDDNGCFATFPSDPSPEQLIDSGPPTIVIDSPEKSSQCDPVSPEDTSEVLNETNSELVTTDKDTENVVYHDEVGDNEQPISQVETIQSIQSFDESSETEQGLEGNTINESTETADSSQSIDDLSGPNECSNYATGSLCMREINQLENLVSNMTSVIDSNITNLTNMRSTEITEQKTIETTTTTFSESTEKTATKKKSSEITGKKKSKKSKKNGPEKENISVKSSSFNKFDALQKKTVLHVRSGDAGKASEKFKNGTPQNEKNCRVCSKPVFQMEMISAEKSCFHKNCFRCATCSKNLTVETYASHESVLYCKPHFKALFAPKVIEDVPASDKPDLGLDEISKSLNVKSRYQVFEHTGETDRTLERTPSTVSVKRSPSILSKLAKFHAKGMDIGVTDESLNSVHYEESSSEAEDEVEEDGDADIELRKSKRIQKEVPVTFGKMSDIKTKFENGHTMTKEERREERKQEIQNIRSRLFMGKQAKIKEMYQQAVLDSEQGITSAKNKPLVETCDKDKAKNIKEKFEKGEFFNQDDDSEENFKNKDTEDMSVFDAGISKKSRSLFLELDATAAARLSQAPSVTPVAKTPEVRKASQVFARDDIVKCGDEAEDVKVETAEISSKFKFFETYKPAERERRQFRITPPRDGVNKIDSPDREVYHDPDVVRAEDCVIEDPDIAVKSHTATKMLFIFRQMEENKEPAAQAGLKPLKRFTPPPPEDSTRRYRSDSESQDGSECEESEEEPDNTTARNGDPVDYVRSSDKFEDEFLKQAQNDARAKQLRAKFEKWESNEIRREQSGINLHEECTDNSQIESAKSLRARFESMGEITSADKIPRAKVNRFV